MFLAALGLSCGVWDLLLQHMGSPLQHAGFCLVVARGLLSSCGVWVFLSLVEAHELSSCGMRGLSCPAACGMLVPRQGIEPASPALEGRFFTTGPTGKSLIYRLKHDLLHYFCFPSLPFPDQHRDFFLFIHSSEEEI